MPSGVESKVKAKANRRASKDFRVRDSKAKAKDSTESQRASRREIQVGVNHLNMTSRITSRAKARDHLTDRVAFTRVHRKGGKGTGKGRGPCHRCGRPGHVAAECRAPHPVPQAHRSINSVEDQIYALLADYADVDSSWHWDDQSWVEPQWDPSWDSEWSTWGVDGTDWNQESWGQEDAQWDQGPTLQQQAQARASQAAQGSQPAPQPLQPGQPQTGQQVAAVYEINHDDENEPPQAVPDSSDDDEPPERVYAFAPVVNSINVTGELDLLVDSGACCHVTPPDFAVDYPLLPLEHQDVQGKLSTAIGTPIQRYGIRYIMFEMISGFYLVFRFLVSNVFMPIIAVPPLLAQGHSAHFEVNDLHLKIHDFKLKFSNINGRFIFNPLRLVPYHESLQLRTPIMAITHGEGNPLQSCQADFWRVRKDTGHPSGSTRDLE